MKKIKNTILYLLVALFLFSSCDKWLTLEPEDGVTLNDYWSTKEEVYAAVIGLYSGMLSNTLTTRMYLWGELRGETMANTSSRMNSDYQAIRDGEITSSNTLTDWSDFYQIINFCNTVVAYAPAAMETDPSFTETLLKQYQAEAIAIRSLLYFYLVRTFRDVPYYTEPYISDDQTMMIAKSSGDSILNCLVLDLEKIAPNIGARYSESAAENKGRMTRGAVYSLLADIYLWQEDYDNCIRNCNRVINSGNYALLYGDDSHLYEVEFLNPVTNLTDTVYAFNESDANEYFKQMYVDGNCKESIFELQRELDFSNTAYYYLFDNVSGYFQAATEVLKELYFIPSELTSVCYDMRGDGVSYKGSYIWKPLGTGRDGAVLSLVRSTYDDWDGNIIMYRLADLYLMKAEALVEQAAAYSGNPADTTVVTDSTQMKLLQEALDNIMIIRKRANATEMTDLCADLGMADLTVSTMEQFVYEERIREMMYEGKRWFDALRFAKRNNYAGNNLNYLMNMAVYGASVTKVGILQNKLKNPDFHYLPINKKELEANKKLVQNPFYAD